MADPAKLSAAHRDPDAWMAEVTPRAVAYAASLLHDSFLAEDIVQDCFYRLLGKRNEYDLQRDGVKLLFRSITNACINASTRGRRILSLQSRRPSEDESTWDIADARSPSPDGAMLLTELQAAVEKALSTLPLSQRAALQLKSQDHTQQEIAEILEVTSSHAGVLVHRARQAMAEQLAPFLGESPQ